ncbi:MAG: UDP-galactose-lipid carrier transferase [Sporolactobacillus sp.]
MSEQYLQKVDLTKQMKDKKQYETKLRKYQLRLLALQQVIRERKLAVAFVFEGWDAAGKGGAIKRAVANLDPRGYNVIPIAAPAPHEKRYHYLQRFWRKLPQYGEIVFFDRSWYGRVLVERVEGFAAKKEWKRAYAEINEFERLLTDDHYIIEKFWLHISKDEQYKRFKEREENPFKHWKITDEDWRNRAKWDDYVPCIEDMLEKTDTDHAPWHVISANSKWHARVTIIKEMVHAIERRLTAENIALPAYADQSADTAHQSPTGNKKD